MLGQRYNKRTEDAARFELYAAPILCHCFENRVISNVPLEHPRYEMSSLGKLWKPKIYNCTSVCRKIERVLK